MIKMVKELNEDDIIEIWAAMQKPEGTKEALRYIMKNVLEGEDVYEKLVTARDQLDAIGAKLNEATAAKKKETPAASQQLQVDPSLEE
jgi:hypothetical protein